ncbi:hypothetical protein BJ165DRAFT_10803 [Panaeolus papilionaceus]|nr:hypothetical protein BJ165DRAFT_10803 [Panaeolus papilionaceus]
MAGFIQDYYIFKPNRKEFNKWHRQLEDMVTCARRLRLTQTLEVYYDEKVLHQTPPSLWSSMPPKAIILTIPSSRRYLSSGTLGVAHVSEWVAVTDDINELVQRWLANSEMPIYLALEAAGCSISESDVRSTISIVSWSTFICHAHLGLQRQALIGWQSIAPHLHCVLDKSGACSPHPPIRFSSAGREIVCAIISSLGRSIYTTTISDLDEANEIFVCGDCGFVPLRNSLGSYFYTWRQAVHHGVFEKPAHRSFAPVNSLVGQCIMSRQRPSPDFACAAWVCNHCPEYHCEPVKRSRVVNHLSKVHKIRAPRNDVDVLYIGDWTPPEPVFLSREPSECYRCLLCKVKIGSSWFDPFQQFATFNLTWKTRRTPVIY